MATLNELREKQAKLVPTPRTDQRIEDRTTRPRRAPRNRGRVRQDHGRFDKIEADAKRRKRSTNARLC